MGSFSKLYFCVNVCRASAISCRERKDVSEAMHVEEVIVAWVENIYNNMGTSSSSGGMENCMVNEEILYA